MLHLRNRRAHWLLNTSPIWFDVYSPPVQIYLGSSLCIRSWRWGNGDGKREIFGESGETRRCLLACRCGVWFGTKWRTKPEFSQRTINFPLLHHIMSVVGEGCEYLYLYRSSPQALNADDMHSFHLLERTRVESCARLDESIRVCWR